MRQIGLTKREQEILQKIVTDGDDIGKNSDDLSITKATFKHHLHSVYQKLNVNALADAIVKALRLGIIELGEIKP